MFKPTDKFHLLTKRCFNNSNYQLKLHEYLVFWDHVQENSDNVIHFLVELTRLIMSVERSKKSSKLESLDCVIATCYCLSMFKKILGDKKRFLMITDLFEKEWLAYDKTKDGSAVRSPYSGEIVNCIFQFLMRSDEKTRIDCILNQIVMIPSSIKKFLNIAANEVSLSDLETNSQIISEQKIPAFFKTFGNYVSQLENYHKQIKQDSLEVISGMLIRDEFQPNDTGECSFVYEYLINFLNENKKKKNSTIPDYILTNISTNLRVITYISAKYPNQAQKSICCLLHIIKQIIVFFPLGVTSENEEQDILLFLISLVKVYKTWAFPVGFLAEELVEILKYETITIGNNFRYKIREEIPALDIFDYELHKNETFLRIAYCIYNENYSSLISGILNHNSEKFNDKTNNFIGLDSHKIRVLLIAHVFSLHNEVTKELLVHLSGLNEIDVFTIYCQLLNTLERCEKIEFVDIKNLQEKALKELATEIYSFRTENSETSYKLQELLFSEFQSFIPIYPDVYLQPIDHRQNEINLGENALKNAKAAINPQMQENGFPEIDAQYEERKIFGNFTLKLKEILEELKQASLPLHQESFKIVVMGEDSELHSLFQELGVLFRLNYLLFTNIDIRIYVVPLGKNTLGKYLACKDLWYNRCVYLPFCKDLLIPKHEIQNEGGANKTGVSNLSPENLHLNFERSIFPFFLKEKLLQSYIREGTRAFPLNVYEVLCFRQKNDNCKKIPSLYFCGRGNKKPPKPSNSPKQPSKFQKEADIPRPEPDATFFFTMYFELGLSVEIQQLLNRRKITGEESLFELREKNLLRFKNLDLEINANYMDFDGNIKPNDHYRGLVESLKINNIYKDGFEGNPPIPNSNVLEMTITDYENSKQRDYSFKNLDLSRRRFAKEEVQNAFFALNMSFSIYSVVITEFNGREFDILVDGKVYSGFQQVIIQPVVSQEKKDFRFTLPIMTFLPLNL